MAKQLKHGATRREKTQHIERSECLLGREGIHLENTAIEPRICAPSYPRILLSIQERVKQKYESTYTTRREASRECCLCDSTSDERAKGDNGCGLHLEGSIRSDELMLVEAVSGWEVDE